jgi:hypothetical protein
MPRPLKNSNEQTLKVLGWVIPALALGSVIILDERSGSNRWHAAVVWTPVALSGVLVWGQKAWKWKSFWLFWVTCFIIHVRTMWLIFRKLFPHSMLGTLYVIPIAFGESVLLIRCFSN